MLHYRDGISHLISSVWFPPHMTLGIMIKDFNPCFIGEENFASYDLRVLQMTFDKLQANCHVPLRSDCPSGRFSSVCAELELCRVWLSGSWSPPWLKAFLLRCRLGGVQVVPNFLQLQMIEATVLIKSLHFSTPFSRSVPWYRQFLGLYQRLYQRL